MTEPYLIGLVGARGHAGAELLHIIARHPRLMLAFAVSREWAGRKVNEISPDILDESIFEALNPEEAAARRSDAIILAMPDGAAASYVEAINKAAPEKIIIDLSADYRFDDKWVYGLPELFRHRIGGARRIANPGCYATAMELAVAPMLPYLFGPPSLFGVSGYSGAGTSPSPRNDVARLEDNLMPYALTGHKHEREASRHLGRSVRFTPHVHPAFRGLVVTAHLPLKEPMSAGDIRRIYDKAFQNEPLIRLQDEPPELKNSAGVNGALIGGFAVAEGGGHAVVVAALDNLLKGAAVQAVQNLNLALGLPELSGIGQNDS
ncbi:MAG: N-acetyl-gamma-glutamyl-phosphate reductase [Alphaproteobacteria bacterium]|nr:N-acetyl-gamma-glutamyl-phosphate reductase [Alphaproteobacteria bacterium]